VDQLALVESSGIPVGWVCRVFAYWSDSYSCCDCEPSRSGSVHTNLCRIWCAGRHRYGYIGPAREPLIGFFSLVGVPCCVTHSWKPIVSVVVWCTTFLCVLKINWDRTDAAKSRQIVARSRLADRIAAAVPTATHLGFAQRGWPKSSVILHSIRAIPPMSAG